MALTREYKEKAPRLTAAQRGLCIVCGNALAHCSCPSTTLDFLREPARIDRPVYLLTEEALCIRWHLCERCGALIKAPLKTPAVRCSGCGFVN
jgi:hypothetical protein